MSFNGNDYDYLFGLASELYRTNLQSRKKEIAVEIMAMVESVRGQQAGWPNISKRYRSLTKYEGIKYEL